MSPAEKKLELKNAAENKFNAMKAAQEKLTSNTGTYRRTQQYKSYQIAKKEYETAKLEYESFE